MLLALFFPFFLSASEGENLNRVIGTLREKNISFEERPLLADYGGFGTSVVVRAPGAETAGRPNENSVGNSAESSAGTFVLAVPLHADFAVDTALVLAEKLASRNGPASVLVAFLGDERNELPPDQGGLDHKGLRDLLSLVDIPENWALCYLDTHEKPAGLFIRHGRRGYVAPLDIIRPLPALFKSRLIPFSFRIRFNEIYKLGLVEGPEVLLITWEDEINSFIISEDTGNMSRDKTISSGNLADFFADYADSLDFPVVNTDRHYYSVTLPGGEFFFITEGHTAILALIMGGILFLFFLIYSAKYYAIFLFNVRFFFRHIWIFFVLLPLLAVSVKAAGIIYNRFLSAFDAAPETANYLGAGLTLGLAVLLFFLPSPLLDLVHFPKRARFYGFSSALFIIMGMFIAAVLDFSYIRVFLWASFFVLVGASAANPILVLSCVLIVPLFPLSALLNIMETGAGTLAGEFTVSGWRTFDDWSAAFQAALISLPLFLLVKRGMLLMRTTRRGDPETKINRKYRLILVPALITAVLGAMAVQVTLLGRPVPPERRIIPAGGTESPEQIFTLSIDDFVFQDSRILTIGAGALENPARVDISIESSGGDSLLPVYSAPVPFERSGDGKTINFSLGERPKNPMTMEIVLPLKFRGLVKASAVYNSWNPKIDPGAKPVSDDYVLRVERKLEIRALE